MLHSLHRITVAVQGTMVQILTEVPSVNPYPEVKKLIKIFLCLSLKYVPLVYIISIWCEDNTVKTLTYLHIKTPEIRKSIPTMAVQTMMTSSVVSTGDPSALMENGNDTSLEQESCFSKAISQRKGGGGRMNSGGASSSSRLRKNWHCGESGHVSQSISSIAVNYDNRKCPHTLDEMQSTRKNMKHV